MEIDKILPEITAILKQYGSEKIILFDSYAYGTPIKDSDIDLLVIKDIPKVKTRDFRFTLKKALWHKLVKFNYSFDIHVENEQRIKERITMEDLFYKEICSNKRIIYA